MLRKLLPFVGKYWKALLLCPLLMVGEVLMEVLIPLRMADIVDVGIANADLAYVIRTGVIMIGMSLLSLAFGAGAARAVAYGGAGFGKNLRGGIFRRIQQFSFFNIDKFSTASLVTRLTTDVNNTQNVIMMGVRAMVRSPLMLILSVVAAARINGRLMLVLAVAIPVLAGAIILIMTQAHPRFRAMLAKYDALNASVQENLTAIRVVKAFVRSDYEKEKFNLSADDVMEAQRKAERIVVFNMPIMQMVIYSCTVAVLWFGGKQIIGGSMLTGELIGFLTYVLQILSSLMMLSFTMMIMVISRASMTRICEVLDEQSDIVSPENGATEVADGSIVFRNVSFSYAKDPDNCVLNDIDLEIRSGETIGLIGGTGSAKSTLVQLIPRLYDVTKGSLIVGGRDVREYDIEALRNQVAMVLQKNVLFSGTIRDNLRWGNPDATDAQIEAACRAASAHDFIMSFPNGYETDLGQGGVNVSGGQKQRLCIARALLKNPKILILDDSTSAVDTATDARIRKALREEISDTTAIIIAQRIASVMDADRIIVLNDGRIADVGTHDELMKRCRIYSDVYETQMKGAEA